MIAVYSGTSAPRMLVDEPSREPTLVFRSPVFDHSADELDVRAQLAARYAARSLYAQARLRVIERVRDGGIPGATARDLLAAFDVQAVELGAKP